MPFVSLLLSFMENISEIYLCAAPAIWVIFIQSEIVAKVSLQWNSAGLRQGIYLARVLQLDDAAMLWAKYQTPFPQMGSSA